MARPPSVCCVGGVIMRRGTAFTAAQRTNGSTVHSRAHATKPDAEPNLNENSPGLSQVNGGPQLLSAREVNCRVTTLFHAMDGNLFSFISEGTEERSLLDVLRDTNGTPLPNEQLKQIADEFAKRHGTFDYPCLNSW